MRHLSSGRKLNRHSSSRIALARGQATALFKHGRIKTTITKAKNLQPFVEKLITTARRHANDHAPDRITATGGAPFTRPTRGTRRQTEGKASPPSDGPSDRKTRPQPSSFTSSMNASCTASPRRVPRR